MPKAIHPKEYLVTVHYTCGHSLEIKTTKKCDRIDLDIAFDKGWLKNRNKISSGNRASSLAKFKKNFDYDIIGKELDLENASKEAENKNQ